MVVGAVTSQMHSHSHHRKKTADDSAKKTVAAAGESSSPRSAMPSSSSDHQSGKDAGGGVGSLTDIPAPAAQPKRTCLQKLHLVLEEPDSSDLARHVSQFVLTTIILSIACFVLATVPDIRDFILWDVVEVGSTVVFTIEFLLRFISCNAMRTKTHLKFITTPMNVLDLLAIAPFYIETALKNLDSVKALRVLRAVRLVRCFRIFKLSKYSAGMHLMVESMTNSVQPLSILTFFLGIGVVLFSSLMYYAERAYCPDVVAIIADGRWDAYMEECADGAGETRDGILCCDKHGSAERFDSITTAFWWSLVTMTTVGYGDRTPKTPLGKIVACMAMLSGIVLISLPVAIVGTKFQQAYEDFEFDKAQKLLSENALEEPWSPGIPVASPGPGEPGEPGESGSPVSPPKNSSPEEKGIRKKKAALAALGEMGRLANETKLDKAAKEEDKKVIQTPSSEKGLNRANSLVGYRSEDDRKKDKKADNKAKEFPSLRMLEPLMDKLKKLESKPNLNKDAHAQVELLLELFEHIERTEKQMDALKRKDCALDVLIQREFLTVSKAYEAHLKAQAEPAVI